MSTEERSLTNVTCVTKHLQRRVTESELDALEDLNAMNYMHWKIVLVLVSPRRQIRQRLPVGALNGGDNAPFT